MNHEYHDGPPPHIGWWLCEGERWRWWDGQGWSWYANDHFNAFEAACWARIRSFPDGPIYRWSHYWPEGARVPRVRP